MSGWTLLAAFARTQERKRQAKLKTKVGSDGSRILTYANFHNTLHGLQGEIGRQLEHYGINTVKQVSDRVAAMLNSSVVALSTTLDDKVQALKDFIDSGGRYAAIEIINLSKSIEVFLQEVERKAIRRHNMMVGAWKAALQMMHTVSVEATNHYANLIDYIHQIGYRLETKMDVVQGTQIALHRNTIEAVNRLQRSFNAGMSGEGPTLMWIIENRAELAILGPLFTALEENGTDPQTKLQVVKSIRAMLTHVSILDIGDAIDQINGQHELKLAA